MGPVRTREGVATTRASGASAPRESGVNCAENIAVSDYVEALRTLALMPRAVRFSFSRALTWSR